VRLCDLPTAGLEVVRDGEFRSLGLLFHQTPELLVCLYDAKARRECEGNAAISCVIAGRELAPLVPERLGLAVSDAPREAFCDVHRHLGSETGFYGEDFPAEVSPDAAVDSGAHLPARRVRIAAGCRIEPGAVVLEGSTLAEDVVVRAGAVVGAEGFQPVPYAGGQQNLPHYGSVELRRGVEVGANAVVCRSAFNEPTEIGEESVLGPQVYVAHGARIGARCRLAASARVAGSARLGDDVFVGPNAVVSSRVAVGSGARVSLGAVVVRDVPPGETVTGNFAVEHERFLAAWRALRRQAGGPEEAGRDRA
jgi:UDP-3-O-[3-hydroxymyristoyl] glucosamine N-acyltransferase